MWMKWIIDWRQYFAVRWENELHKSHYHDAINAEQQLKQCDGLKRSLVVARRDVRTPRASPKLCDSQRLRDILNLTLPRKIISNPFLKNDSQMTPTSFEIEFSLVTFGDSFERVIGFSLGDVNAWKVHCFLMILKDVIAGPKCTEICKRQLSFC